jgi:transmembrane sensor
MNGSTGEGSGTDLPADCYEAASEWLQLLNSRDVTEAQLQGWLEWFSAAEENTAAFEEMQRLYRRFAQLPPQLKQRLLERSQSHKLGSWSRFRSQSLRLTLAASVLVILCANVVWLLWASPTAVTYTAPLNQHRTVRLPDGSAVVLGPDSKVAVRYSRVSRRLDLERGQAYFQVQHNKSRPFVVRSGVVQVVAVGTAFNVSTSHGEVAVTVTDGVVEIGREGVSDAEIRSGAAGDDQHMRVSVGHRVVLASVQSMRNDTVSVHADAIQWNQERIALVGARLSDVIAVVNQRSAHRIVIDDPRVADLMFSGTVMQDHIDEWIGALPKIYPIQAIPLDDGSIGLFVRADYSGPE